MPTSESGVQTQTRLMHCQTTNGHIWRNNSGAYQDERGNFIRYGLANESKQLNAQIKSADLIGITPITITPDMVGKTVGVFTAYECKPPGWKLLPSDKRGLAQERFLAIVKASGGFGGFVTDPSDIFGVMNFG